MTEKSPNIYKSLLNILKDLEVEADGKLPSNLGSSNYQTASNISAKVKQLFVQNNLILIPNEEVISEDHVTHNNRLNILVLIKGTYTLIDTSDGSSVDVVGHGHGIATGTALASNIASTFALKNALLRTFLITEQSVENMAQKDLANAEAAPQGGTQGAIEKARKASKPKNPGGVTALRNKIRDEFITTEKFSSQEVTALRDKIKKERGIEDAVELHEELYKELSK